jgi:hypothetical protein
MSIPSVARRSEAMSQNDPSPTGAPTPETLKQALKAFRKSLRVTQLDSDSQIRGRALSGGSTPIVAMTPPSQFPKAVWDELVKQGKLKYVGHGMYELVP